MKPRPFRIAQVMAMRLSHARESSTVLPFLEKFISSRATAAQTTAVTVEIDAIKSYVRSLQSAQTSRILLVNTHHSTLDALLNQKALVARNRSIDVQFRVNDLSAVKIDLVDLTVIISNTLDNAIEACEKLPVQERQIYVQVVLNDNELFYAVRNRSLPIDVSSDRLPVTTKENPSFHGYGLQNVQTTLAKYHSVYAMDYADGWFEFATDLPNTLIS